MLDIPIEDMTIEEKLRAMEVLWDDLSRRAGVPAPPWHGEALVDREAALERGDDSFEDWERAKTDIANRSK